MADAIFDQGMAGAAAQALQQRKQQLLAQEALAMGQQPAAQPMPAAPASAPTMTQAQFGGYPNSGRPQMTPQQAQQLARLLMARQAAQ